jgi:hypothetical protein
MFNTYDCVRMDECIHDELEMRWNEETVAFVQLHGLTVDSHGKPPPPSEIFEITTRS